MHTEICGKINYRNSESLKTAVKRLEKWGWVTKDHFTDNSGNYIDDEMPDIDYKKLTIEILWFSYHSLVMHLDNLFAKGNGKGRVVWASSDGEFEGGVIVDGKETVYNLAEWAKSNGIEEPPNEDEDEDEDSTDPDFESEVIDAFMEFHLAEK
jgi:hypothetical protein